MPRNVQSFHEQIEVLPNPLHQNADRLQLTGWWRNLRVVQETTLSSDLSHSLTGKLEPDLSENNRCLSLTAPTKLSGVTSDQLVSMEYPNDTNLLRRRMHRSAPLLTDTVMTRAGPNQRPDLGGAPITPRVTLSTTEEHDPSSTRQLDGFLASGVLSTTDGISLAGCGLLLPSEVSIPEGIVVVNPCPTLSAPDAH